MTDIQHEHAQRDLAALQAAEKKYEAAKGRLEMARALASDAGRTLDAARNRYRVSAAARLVAGDKFSEAPNS